jgi:hypothetical protein
VIQLGGGNWIIQTIVIVSWWIFFEIGLRVGTKRFKKEIERKESDR